MPGVPCGEAKVKPLDARLRASEMRREALIDADHMIACMHMGLEEAAVAFLRSCCKRQRKAQMLDDLVDRIEEIQNEVNREAL